MAANLFDNIAVLSPCQLPASTTSFHSELTTFQFGAASSLNCLSTAEPSLSASVHSSRSFHVSRRSEEERTEAKKLMLREKKSYSCLMNVVCMSFIYSLQEEFHYAFFSYLLSSLISHSLNSFSFVFSTTKHVLWLCWPPF